MKKYRAPAPRPRHQERGPHRARAARGLERGRTRSHEADHRHGGEDIQHPGARPRIGLSVRFPAAAFGVDDVGTDVISERRAAANPESITTGQGLWIPVLGLRPRPGMTPFITLSNDQ